ncbi:MAG: hypothetical protein V1851_00125 [Patescibacteria group bacterium]
MPDEKKEENFYVPKQEHQVISVGCCTYTIPCGKKCLTFSDGNSFSTKHENERR